ncbi:MAG: DNA polymerase I [Candidatus Omnitrophica bacterium]|nr:DNA polymerase I [Candidatus Omnitrophota bacterium]
MSQPNKSLLLIDGTAVAYQAFFAIKNLTSPEGRPTGAIYGFYQTLQSLREEFQPDCLAVVLDRGEPVERTEAYKEYKADRPPTPTELLEQFPTIEEITTLMGVSVLSIEGVEADDIMGTLAERAGADGVQTLIFSPDKDMLQMVNGNTRVIRRHGQNTKIYDPDAVVEKYGCGPEQFPDFLGLMGDKVDSIPGVPGVGEKTAASLLQEYGDLESILSHASEISKPKLRQNLTEFADKARLSKELATINRAVDLDVELKDLAPVEPDWSKAFTIFKKLGFRTASEQAQKNLNGQASFDWGEEEPQSEEFDYQLVTDEKALKALVKELSSLPRFGIDTETTDVDPFVAKLVGICLGTSEGKGWYIPVSHQAGTNLALDEIQKTLGPLLENEKVGKLAHHLKYDDRILRRHGLPVRGWEGDTMVLAHLLHSQEESLKLDDLVKKYLGRKMIPIKDLIGEKKSDQITFDHVDPETAMKYGAEDAEATATLYDKLESELKDLEEVGKWYREIEMPLTLLIEEMEDKGVQVDPNILKKQSKEVQGLIDAARKELFELAGREFNPNSPKQLATLLFDERGVPETRNRTTKQEVLEDLARSGEPLAEKVIEYRQLTKLKSTYLDALPDLIKEGDERVHTSYNTTVANTGRISSSNPNLQNIPVRSDLGRRVREAFVAAEGRRFIAADYSQIELRVLAHYSKDPGFQKAFQEGLDIHAFTASEIFDVPADQVDKDMRRKAKEINFGLNYGMSSFGLASRLNISRGEARDYMDRYFERYPKIKSYFDDTLEAAERDGYVTTIVGRRVEVPRPRSRTGREARAAINAPIQGSASDILKKAMVEVGRQISERDLEAAMVLTVHDEIILEAPEDELEEVREFLEPTMTGAIELDVPIEVDVRVGRSWAELG